MARSRELRVVISGDTRSLDRALRNATRSADRMGSNLGRAAHRGGIALAGLGTAAAVGVGGAFVSVIKKAADFEAQISALGATVNANAAQMTQLKKQALAAGVATKFSALEAAKAQTELAKGGVSLQDILKGGLEGALALAAAGEMDLAAAASTTANALNLFGLKGKQAGHVADVLAQAANSTTADVADFAMALSQGGSAAKAAGMSFDQTVVALEALAKGGVKSSDAGTSLKTALIHLAKPTDDAALMMKGLGLEFFDSHGKVKDLADISGMLGDKLGGMGHKQREATLATIAGTDGFRSLLSLYDAGPEKIKKWTEEQKKEGQAAEIARKKQDNLKGAIENLRGSIETTAISVGTAFLPLLTDAAQGVTKYVNKITPALTHVSNSISKTLGDKSLTSAEKWSAIRRSISHHLGPIAKDMERKLGELKLGQKLGAAIEEAAPRIADAMAKVAGKAAVAFIHAFQNMGPWGKLITVAFLASKLGAFNAAGSAAAGLFTKGTKRVLAGSLRFIFAKEGAKAGAAAGAAAAGTQGIGGAAGKFAAAGRVAGIAFRTGLLAAATLGLAAAVAKIVDELTHPQHIGDKLNEIQREIDQRKNDVAGDPRSGVGPHGAPGATSPPPKHKAKGAVASAAGVGGGGGAIASAAAARKKKAPKPPKPTVGVNPFTGKVQSHTPAEWRKIRARHTSAKRHADDVVDRVDRVLETVDKRERAGQISPAKAGEERRRILRRAIAGGYGKLTASQRLEYKAQLHESFVSRDEAKASAVEEAKAKADEAQAKIDEAPKPMTPAEYVADAISGIDSSVESGLITKAQGEDYKDRVFAAAAAGQLGALTPGQTERLGAIETDTLGAGKGYFAEPPGGSDAATTSDLQASIDALKDEMAATRRWAQQVHATTDSTLRQGLAEAVSGYIVGIGYAPRAMTAGAGVGGRY